MARTNDPSTRTVTRRDLLAGAGGAPGQHDLLRRALGKGDEDRAVSIHDHRRVDLVDSVVQADQDRLGPDRSTVGAGRERQIEFRAVAVGPGGPDGRGVDGVAGHDQPPVLTVTEIAMRT